MEFIVKLKDPGPAFNVDLGAVYIYRWSGTEWILVGEIKIMQGN